MSMTLAGSETGNRLNYRGFRVERRPPTGQRRLGTLKRFS